MSKTPFEIRLEVLRMAKEMLEHDYFTKKETLLNAWQAEVGIAQERGLEVPQQPQLPQYPDTTAIIKKAQELNTFISNVL